ncbi:MAG: hypothetical protein Q8K38_01425 [Burkholderiaceae bacterium]|nr:hypothetical protein [Burkholderiaceae bacterium]MDZ4145072.1 hypothetical protein [Burkholderiales bacterium]
MSKKSGIPGTVDAWENGALGMSEAHVKQAPADMEQQIDDALGLQAISIRLPKATIQVYKNLAELHGVGYQPLMRDAIVRWADSELKQLLSGAVESQRMRSKGTGKHPAGHRDGGASAPVKKAA